MVEARLADLADLAGVEYSGDADTLIHGVGTLEHALPGQITFLTSAKYSKYLKDTQASAVILSAEWIGDCPRPALICKNPTLTYAKIAGFLYPPDKPMEGAHPSAVIAASAKIHPGASIGPLTFIGEGVVIEAGVIIGPGCIIGHHCRIGESSRLIARVTLCDHVTIGRECIVHPGAVLGSDGFGLAHDQGKWINVPQLGGVRLGDRVDIGANTTIDRGAIEDTVIADGVKLDNQVHVAHNVTIGDDTAIAGCTGIAGSTKIGEQCTFGGMSAIAGHIEIGDNVHFTGMSMVTGSHKKAGQYSSNLPSMESDKWRRAVVRIRQLDDIAKRLKSIEEKMNK